jgi:class 3 adenylate cyclase
MDARDIHFATTEDGLGIAYWTFGSGPPLVYIHNLSFSHAELEWDVPSFADFYERLAEHFTLVRIDLRGSGLSDDVGDVVGYQLEGFCRDLDAVIGALGLESVALMGASNVGLVAAEYAATRPQRVASLILCDTGPSVEDLPMIQYVRAQRALAESGVDMLPNTSAVVPSGETAEFEALMRGGLHEGAAVAPAIEGWDVTDRLPHITAPTLVMRSKSSIHSNNEQSRRLVRDIPSAQMRVVDGMWCPIHADREAVIDAVVQFLQPAAGGLPSSSMQTIVFTDLVASTSVLGRLGDEEGRQAFRQVETLVAELADSHDGRLIKNLGDGSLLTFESTAGALRFALGLQDQMRSNDLRLRIGLAVGEPIQEEEDVHGSVVVLASRIADLADAGDVFASDAVRQLTIGKGFDFEGVGEVPLKGFDQPIPVWRVLSGEPSTDG